MDDDDYYDFGDEAWSSSLYSNYPYEDWWNATSNFAQTTDLPSGSVIDYFGGADAFRNFLTDTTGKINLEKLFTYGGGIAGLLGLGQNKEKVGYQGKIPSYTAVRQQIPQTYDPTRRPGSGGQRYFTDIGYAIPEGEKANIEAISGKIAEQAPVLQAANLANPARQTIPQVEEKAMGGIVGLAKGRYLGGPTDGMADKIPAKIGESQPAALSHGEFVIPADVVSHLGNGNSEAGAKQLYSMMDRIRKARTGNKKQGKQINPSKYLPT